MLLARLRCQHPGRKSIMRRWVRQVLAGAVSCVTPCILTSSASAAQTWTAAAGDTTLAASIANGGNLLSVAGARNTRIVGGVSGSGGIVKNGAGTLTLSGSVANSYTGNTSVNAGTLALNKLASNATIVGNLVIGDDVGGANADVVRLDRSDQIDDFS